jgi:hypothetical protein
VDKKPEMAIRLDNDPFVAAAISDDPEIFLGDLAEEVASAASPIIPDFLETDQLPVAAAVFKKDGRRMLCVVNQSLETVYVPLKTDQSITVLNPTTGTIRPHPPSSECPFHLRED